MDKGVGYAMLCSVFVLIGVAIFIATLNSLVIEGTPRVPPVCPESSTGTITFIDGSTSTWLNQLSLYAGAYEVTGKRSSGSNLVEVDGTQCSFVPGNARNSNTFEAQTAAVAAVAGRLLGAEGYSLVVVVMRLVTSVAGLGIVVLIWRSAMMSN